MSENQVIYIAGYGRSGSTLLESILNQHSQVVGLGELSFFLKLINDSNVKCACNHTLQNCEFWNPIAQLLLTKFCESPETLYALQLQFEGVGKWKGPTPQLRSSQTMVDYYKQIIDALFCEIYSQVPIGTRYLVDSSKTAYTSHRRPHSLIKTCGMNLKVIHLVRDVRGVMWSVIHRGLNRFLEKDQEKQTTLAGFRSLIGWIIANKSASELQKIVPADNYLLVRYEDLMELPELVLAQIGEFVSLDLQSVAHTLSSGLNSESHQVAGNRMRYQTSVKLQADLAWHSSMPSHYKMLAQIFALPQLLKYGYL